MVSKYNNKNKIAILILIFFYTIISILWMFFYNANIKYNMTIGYINIIFALITGGLIFYLIYDRYIIYSKLQQTITLNIKLNGKLQKFLLESSTYDHLTYLSNGQYMIDEMDNIIHNNPSIKYAVLLMDIDNFKTINDISGHKIGDRYLQYIARILKSYESESIHIYRLGGDEFVVILFHADKKEDIEFLAQRILNDINEKWIYKDQEYYESVSIGIASFPKDGSDFSTILQNAEISMFNVKKSSKNNYIFYSENMQKQNIEKVNMVNDIYHALENNEFELYYQPILNINNHTILGAEALIRWNHPVKGLISPGAFIPIAEESDLITKISEWVFKTAIHQKAIWSDQGYKDLKLSINISGKGLTKNGFLSEISDLLCTEHVDPKTIQIEITETSLITNFSQSINVLRKLKDMGIQIALDDFGTGYSSLTYLKNLPIDVVKLDHNFIRNIITDAPDSLIAKTIIELTHKLKLKVVAEGIETNEQLHVLQDIYCEYGQGYLFSRPVKTDAFEKLL